MTGHIMTVTGAIAPEEVQVSLTHEHVFSIFGLDPTLEPDYDYAHVSDTVLPTLLRLRHFGCSTVFEATPAYLGRDVRLLRQLSVASGIRLVTNTGYYAAADDRYVPAHAYSDSVQDLATRWVREWEDGIADTEIRPGFIKIGVDSEPLSEIDAKIVRAAALAHLETGLAIAAHTANNPTAAREQLAILKDEGVAPSAWIWVHAHVVDDVNALLEAAAEGAWLSLDGLTIENIPEFVERIEILRANGYFGQILLSHDGNHYPQKGQGTPRPYEALFTDFIPALEARGFSRDEIAQLTAENSSRAFTIRVQKSR